MKCYAGILAILVTVGLISYTAGKKAERKKSMDAFGYSAEWGCYQGARQACDHLQTEQEVAACQEEALDFCPKAGAAFKKFMEQGRR